MLSPLQVVFCGQSLYLQAVAANLDTQPHIQTTLVNPHHQAMERVTALSPDVIIVDHNEPVLVELIFALLDKGYPLLDLDMQQNTIAVMTKRRVKATTPDDLAQLIGYVVDMQSLPAGKLPLQEGGK